MRLAQPAEVALLRLIAVAARVLAAAQQPLLGVHARRRQRKGHPPAPRRAVVRAHLLGRQSLRERAHARVGLAVVKTEGTPHLDVHLRLGLRVGRGRRLRGPVVGTPPRADHRERAQLCPQLERVTLAPAAATAKGVGGALQQCGALLRLERLVGEHRVGVLEGV